MEFVNGYIKIAGPAKEYCLKPSKPPHTLRQRRVSLLLKRINRAGATFTAVFKGRSSSKAAQCRTEEAESCATPACTFY
jgi:hypothetical protein